MKVIVCIKQVPSGSIALDDRGILDRSQGGGQLNPRDCYALEAAMQIAEATDGQVTALTMGPPSAEQVLKTAFSMGAAHGILLTDRAFSGADVYATAYTLSQAIASLGPFDVAICGQQSTDGDTAELPFSLAAQLGIPAVGWVKKLQTGKNGFLLSQELSGGTQQIRQPVPCLLAVGPGIGRPRIPSLRSQLRAKKQAVQIMTLEDLPDRNPEHYGLAGSHTRVVKVETLKRERKYPPVPMSGEEGARAILSLIKEVGSHG